MRGVVTHQHGEAVAFQSLHGLGQVAISGEGRTTIVFDACNDEGVLSTMEDTMLVEEECPTVTADAALQFLHIGRTFIFFRISDIHAVIMVAHHGIDTIRSMEFVEVTTEAVEFCALVIDKVAREKDGITMLGIDEVNDGADITFVSVTHGADMKVGELGDAIAVELLGQVGEIESLLMDDILVASDEIAVSEQGDGEERECHADDAEDAHEDAVVALTRFLSSCYYPIDEMSDAIYHHEEGFGGTKEEEHIHVDADPCLMLWTHVVAGDDECSGNGQCQGWHEPQEAQPSLLGPVVDVHPVDVQVGQDQQEYNKE